ncbi:MAG: hypothetical protein ABSA44_04335 [Bacteroidota bacterium]
MAHKRMYAYLSGGMEYALNEGKDWRWDIENWIQKSLKHKVFNPNVASDQYLRKVLHKNNFRNLKSTNLDTYIKIVQKFVIQDSKEIATRSDYVICYWDMSAQQGAGTKGELTIAKYFKKPIYLVTHMPKEKIPGWVLGCVTEFFSSLEDLKEYLIQNYTSITH